MKKQQQISFHNPNSKKDMAVFLSALLAESLVEQVIEEPNNFYEMILNLNNEEEIENSSLL